MVESRSRGTRFFRVVNYVLLAAFGVICILPFVHVLAVSFSDRAATAGGLVTFWPLNFTTVSYEKVLSAGTFLRSFGISVQRTLLGTVINMVLTILTAYPLSKTAQEFRGRDLFMWFVLFALLFSGGLIPLFLVIRNLNMLDTMWALVLPTAVPIWNVILLMNFFREIPAELDEAALVDGASHWQRLWHVFLPLSVPALATLTLFSAVGHWNAWFDGIVFMREENYPLQSFLRTVVIELDLSQVVTDVTQLQQYSDRSIRAAQIFVTTVPILLVYPFLQRYFVAGIRVGAVKG